MIGPYYFLIIALVWAIVVFLAWILAKYLQGVYDSSKTIFDKIMNPIDNVIYKILGIDKKS